MRLDEFSRLLETYGADPAHWPEARRMAAQALLEVSPGAQALHNSARFLDNALDVSLPGPDAAAMARMRGKLARAVAREPLPRAEAGLLRLLRPWAPMGAGALVTLAVCALWMSRPLPPQSDEILGAPRLMAMMDTLP
ncbi:hypothetical protein ACFOD4_12940 [Pseudoroseomonas globiformis]|uniref:Uncharacterized protein n=1 Tax=Teichococcus globiformis TaxID=2307229 RepID=A0ABV7G290_9PROT